MAKKPASQLTPEDWAAVVESFRKACENAAEAMRLFKDAWNNKEAPRDSGPLK